MCDHQNREAAMVVLDEFPPIPGVHKGVWCDPCLAPLVRALNEAGMATVASCCGHSQGPGNIALADGRWLFVAADRGEADRLFDLIHARCDSGG